MSEQDKEVKVKLSLDSVGLVTGAKAGVEELNKLKSSIEGDNRELAAMQKALRAVENAAKPNTEAIDKLKRVIDSQRDSVAKANLDYIAQGGNLQDIGKKTKDLTKELEKQKQAQDKLKEENQSTAARQADEQRKKLKALGVVTEEVKDESNDLSKSLRSAVFVGSLQAKVLSKVAEGAYAAAKAVRDATVDLYKFAEANANARRSELLHLEGLTTVRNFYGVAKGSAVEMRAAIDRVSASSALSRDKIAGYAEQLYVAGLRGENLSAALEGTALKAQVQGEQWAQMFASIAQGTALSGGNVTKLTARVKAQLGGIASKQLMDTNVQAMKLRESFSLLTDGLKIDKLLAAKQSLFLLFSQSTASGQALKNVLTTFGQIMIDGATRGWNTLKPILQDWVYYLLRIENMYLRVATAWDNFNSGKVFTRQAKAKNALNRDDTDQQIRQNRIRQAGDSKSAALPLGFGENDKDKPLSLADFLKKQRELQPKAIAPVAATISEGLKLGIDLHALDKPLQSTAKSGIATFKKTIDAHSPSRVFAELGATIPAGVERGIKDGEASMRRAIEALGKRPKRFAEREDLAMSVEEPASSSSSNSITIQSITIQTAATDASGIGQALRVALENELRNVTFQAGA